MKKSRLRSLLLSSAAGAAMVAAAGSANALEYQFGGVQVYFDTTVSAGVSVRASERNNLFLPEGNGGPVDLRTTTNVIENTTAATAVGFPGTVTIDGNGDNFDGSLNTDDGRLNFDEWDLTSGVVKMTNDIQASWQNYTLFARVNSFYDAVLDNDSSYERSEIGDGAKTDAARDIDLLDLYVSADYNVGDLPLNLRLGRQVINWGEGTFILNGINTVAPLDVNAFRRPGAEIKEGLLPVWAAYGSIGLPYNLALEGFYQLEWEEIQLDRPGTPFADSDVVNVGSLTGGNVDAVSFIGGSPFSGTFRRNCAGSPVAQAALLGAFAGVGVTAGSFAASSGNPAGDCAASAFVNYNTAIPIGQNEQVRLALGDRNIVGRIEDKEASDSGQYGVALRWYSEELNSTEFGFYFMNYHSRLPIAEIAATTPQVTVSTTADDTSALTRFVGTTGCLSFLNSGNFADPTLAALNNVAIADPNGYIASFAGVADGILAGAAVPGYTGTEVRADGQTFGALAQINCALTAAQTVSVSDPSLVPDALSAGVAQALSISNAAAKNVINGVGALVNGAETLNVASGHTLRLVYPEDIKLFGASFNTTVGDWGVQGEAAFRPNQPLQTDTDSQTIASGFSQCALVALAGDAAGAFAGLATQPGAACDPANIGNQSFTSYVREEVVTAQIGTTATYTNSNPLIGFLGSDLGILVTEVGTMWVPDVPDEGDFSKVQLGNVCTAGTDLPLGGLLALDPRSGCRPTSFSWGYVLLGQLQYNNAFGTPITLNPTIAWQHDVAGNSPSPLSNYREGRKRVSLALNGSYQSSWRGGISYTNFFGNEKYSRDGDRDFVSVNLSYSF